MAIAVGSVSNTPLWGTRTSAVITAPSGITNGDLLVACLDIGSSAGLVSCTPPAGWTQVTNSPSSQADSGGSYTLSCRVFWKVASGEAGNYTFAHGLGDSQGFMYRLTGANTTTPIDANPVTATANLTSNGQTDTFASVTTITNGCFVICFSTTWDGTGAGTVSGTSPTISLRRAGDFSFIGDGTQTTAGATGSRTRTNGNAAGTTPWCSIVVPIRPAAAGGSPYTLTADKADFTLTGQTAELKYGPWQLVGVGTSVEVTGTSHTLTVPAGVAQGDLLIAVISSRIASTTSITLPTGGEWTRIAEQKTNNILSTGSAVASGMMAYCIRGASNPNLTFTHPTAPSVALGRIVAYRGGYVGGWLDQSTSATTAVSTTAVSVTGVTTAYAGDLIVVGLCGGQEAAWSSVDAVTSPGTASGATNTTQHPTYETWLERADQVTTTSVDTSLGIADAVKRTAGATGNITATASVAASHAVLIAAFRPPAVSGSPYTLTADQGAFALTGQSVGLASDHDGGAGGVRAEWPACWTEARPETDGDVWRARDVQSDGPNRRAATVESAAGGGASHVQSDRPGRRSAPDDDRCHGRVRTQWPDRDAEALAGDDCRFRRGQYVQPVRYRRDSRLFGRGRAVDAGGCRAVRPERPDGWTKARAEADRHVQCVQHLQPDRTDSHPAADQTAADCREGSFVLNGQAVVLRRTMPAVFGSFALSGQTATLRRSRALPATFQTFNLTGQGVVLRRTVTAGQASFTLNGQAMAFRRTMTAVAGAFALNGQTATLKRSRVMPAAWQQFNLNGIAVILDWSAAGATSMPAGVGAFALSGQDIALRRTRVMSAAFGTVNLTGQQILLKRSYVQSATTTPFQLVGMNVNLIADISLNYVLDADHATFALSGQTAELTWQEVSTEPLEVQPGRLTFGHRRAILRRW